ncbi:MAG: hypothetical protein QOF61_1565 [Acidobacteriota bacterium]|jgi:hypothetical protein|nr:hypothetical protein [Acidobacteriota bacterium]
MKNYTGVEEQVEYGLDTISLDRKIEVSLRDLMYAYQTFGLLVNFFHNPDHFPTLESVNKFLGDDECGAMHLLKENYYRRLYDVFPPDIRRGFEESRYYNPDPPYYYKPDSE